MDRLLVQFELIIYFIVISSLGILGQFEDPAAIHAATKLYYVNPTDYSHQLINLADTEFLDPEKITCFLSHGYLQSHNDVLIVAALKALVDSGYNAIAIDFSEISKRPYLELTTYLPDVARVVSDYIVKNQLDTSKIILVGFSLGAHVCGFVGKQVQSQGYEICKIFGLDPAGPNYGTTELVACKDRLCATDAEIVITLQTNGGQFGTAFRIGIVHFIANGGYVQPGCSFDSICSHMKAVNLFTESFQTVFVGIRKDDDHTLIFNMDIPLNEYGIYELTTE